MNNKEAIDILNNKLNIAYFSSEDNEALDLAIKALEDARPTGKWIPQQYHMWHRAYECSICGNVIDTDDYGDGNFSYCDKCGAKMEAEND